MLKKTTVILFLILCSAVFAQEFAGGTGMESDPYLVSTPAQLDYVRNFTYAGVYFKQTADIDLGEYKNDGGWVPIGLNASNGNVTPFYGNYDGQGYVIRNMTITRDGFNEQGLFSELSGAAVKNVVLKGVSITTNNSNFVGAIAGKALAQSHIIKCGSEGNINAHAIAGGIVGEASFSYISQSYSRCSIVTTNLHTGGLCGYTTSSSEIDNCYFAGSLNGGSGEAGGSTIMSAGGIIGTHEYSDPLFKATNCYVMGSVVSNGYNYYAINGNAGLTPDASGCYALAGIYAESSSASEKSAAEMKVQSTFNGWDFTNIPIWKIEADKNNGYPYLAWQSIEDPLTAPELGWSQMRLKWKKGAGERRTVFVSATTTSNFTPMDGIDYIANRNFGNENFYSDGTGNPWKCVYDGDGDGTVITGLSANTPYIVQIYEYNGSGSGRTYINPTAVSSGVNSVIFTTSTANIFSGGNGSPTDPFQVANADQLNLLKTKNESGMFTYLNMGIYYIQTSDIDLSGYDCWEPIGQIDGVNSPTGFRGHYNGQNHEIRNLTITSAQSYASTGLFGAVSYESEIKNLKLINSIVTGTTNTGCLIGTLGAYIGPIPESAQPGQVINCSTSGSASGTSCVGGLIGYISEPCFLARSVMFCSSSAAVTASEQYGGGLVGMTENAVIANCYATGNVNGTRNSGGLVGNMDFNSKFYSSYALGDVNAAADNSNGWLSGTLSGSSLSPFILWKTDGRNVNMGISYGTGISAADMQSQDYFSGNFSIIGPWDFNDAWKLDAAKVINGGYPYLEWNEPSAPASQPYDLALLPVADQPGSMTVSWKNGDGRGRAVFVMEDNGSSNPVCNIDTNRIYNSIINITQSDFNMCIPAYGVPGSPGASLWRCVYASVHGDPTAAATSVLVTGLKKATKYYVAAFEFNNSGFFNRYKLDGINYASAYSASDFAEGLGTEESPYIVNTAVQLAQVALSDYSDKYFRLGADIDLSSIENWTPLGSEAAPFTGYFDGNSKTIYGMKIDKSSEYSSDYCGLFGYVTAGEIKNVIIDNANIKYQGANPVGTLAGYTAVPVSNCSVRNSVISVPNSGENCFTGGLIGSSVSTIEKCYTDITISAPNSSNIGGLVGRIGGAFAGAGAISKSYSMGQISGVGYIGGLAGYAAPQASLSDCYSFCKVTATGDYAAGLIGYFDCPVTNCYSVGEVTAASAAHLGGLLGYNPGSGTITNSYWNRETSGQISSQGGTGTFTYDMTLPSAEVYKTWDFTSVWSINSSINGGYPYLQGMTIPLPVELQALSAEAISGQILLKWKTATETDNYGFEIERKNGSETGAIWTSVGFVKGNGNSNSAKSYSFTDFPDGGVNYKYRLKQIDVSGKCIYSEEVAVKAELPADYALDQNYPNPFNPTTKIRYELPQNGFVSIKVYDLLGCEVQTLVSGQKEAGYHEVEFNANNLSSGLYVYRIQAGKYSQTRKMLLVR